MRTGVKGLTRVWHRPPPQKGGARCLRTRPPPQERGLLSPRTESPPSKMVDGNQVGHWESDRKGLFYQNKLIKKVFFNFGLKTGENVLWTPTCHTVGRKNRKLGGQIQDLRIGHPVNMRERVSATVLGHTKAALLRPSSHRTRKHVCRQIFTQIL